MARSFEFTVGGRRYRAKPLAEDKRADLMRRIAPIFMAVMTSKKDDRLHEILKAIYTLPEGDGDHVHDTCMSAVSRRAGTGWQKIWRSDRTFFFGDIDAQAALNIFFNVISREITASTN